MGSRRCASRASRGRPASPPARRPGLAVSLQPVQGKETVMKSLLLCGITLLGSSVAFAQRPIPPDAGAAPRTIMLTGCVGRGGTSAQPFTLTSAIVVPATEQAGIVTPSPIPAAASPPPTRPPAATRTARATGTPGAVGTSGTIVAGTAPAGSSSSSASGYTLSGIDLSAWMGRRVQIVGSLVPAAASAAAPSPTSIGAARIGPDGSPLLPELRVVSVSPVTGDCPR